MENSDLLTVPISTGISVVEVSEVVDAEQVEVVVEMEPELVVGLYSVSLPVLLFKSLPPSALMVLNLSFVLSVKHNFNVHLLVIFLWFF